jgi:hypothetical protein
VTDEDLYEHYKLIDMTRYEFFEAWLTTEEWVEWKKHCVKRFRQLHSMTLRQAKAQRRRYLDQDMTFITQNIHSVANDWDDMTNRHLRWSDTAQGHSYWSSVNSRTAPCRTLPPQRTITNTPN